MSGRGGRGLLLASLQKQRRPGENDEEAATNQAPTAPPPASTPVVGIGRARLLQHVQAQQVAAQREPQMSVTAPAPVASTGSAPLGRGRALLMQRLGAPAVGQAAPTPAATPPPPTTSAPAPTPSIPAPATSAPAQPSGVEGVERGLARMGFRSRPDEPYREPVIRMGKEGKPFNACLNYIRFNVKQNMGVFEYEVRFNPSVDAKKFRYQMIRQHSDEIGYTMKSFDSVKLYLPIRLPREENRYTCSHPGDGSVVEMNIIFKKQHRMSEALHLYNVLFRRVMGSLNLTQVGRNYFDSENSKQIPQHKLEVWPGYITAVDEYEGGLMINCDVSHRVLRRVKVLEVMSDIVKNRPSQPQEEIKKALLGLTVLTMYNNKTYRIDDVDFEANPLSSFVKSSGESITYKEYYQSTYNIRISDDRQPLLIHKETRKMRGMENKTQIVALIPELCYLTGLNDQMRSDFRLMKDLGEHTRVKPKDREASLLGFIKRVTCSPEAKKILDEWGLTLEPQLLRMQGRQFEYEQILLGNNVVASTGPKSDFSRDVTRNRMLQPVDLGSWLLVFCAKNERNVKEFFNCLVKVGYDLGMNVAPPERACLKSDSTAEYVREIRARIHPQLQMVVCIFPTQREDRYSAVKKLCCAESPVASQCINDKTISRADKLRSVVQKIALQINCKLGGELWGIRIPIKKAMIVGIDVYHDPTRKGRSVAGIVASLNDYATRWFSQTAFQDPGQELIDALKVPFVTAMKRYRDTNGYLPDNIILYRDGVGDGMLGFSRDYELPQFKETFNNVNGNYKPNFTAVIVQKRINTRVFAQLGQGLDNPGPGSVIDNTVTRRNWFDFFLVSQHVNQGTVTPTHYVSLDETSNLTPDQLQRLSYKLTMMYYNWPGAVRVPAPCQYAHKLAYLVGQNVGKKPSDILNDRLFYL